MERRGARARGVAMNAVIVAESVPRPLAFRALVATGDDKASLLLRVTYALVLWPHGAQHALGWFGGFGFSGTHHWMTHTLGFPAPLAALAIVVELLAPLALLAGAGGRVAALSLAGLMVGAISTHLPNGFFMNWFGQLTSGQ